MTPNHSFQRTLTRDGFGPLNSDRQAKGRKKTMPNRLLTSGTFLAVVISSVACATGGDANGGALTIESPPVDILEGNFAQAAYVLEIEVEDVRHVTTIRSDSGEVGYVQFSVTGTILDVLKSSEEREAFSHSVEYRFTQEYDPGADPWITKGGRYLVFLMKADDPPRFWVIGNGAQFILSPQLSKTIRQIAAHQ